MSEKKRTAQTSTSTATVVRLRDGLKRATEALTEILKHHNIKNDLDAYLYEVARYGLGQVEKRPESKYYGVGEAT